MHVSFSKGNTEGLWTQRASYINVAIVMNGTIEITGPYPLLCDLHSKALVKVAINPFDLKRCYTWATRGEVILIWPDPKPIPWPTCPFTIDKRPSVLVPLLNLYTLWEQAWSICVTALPTCMCVGCKAAQQQQQPQQQLRQLHCLLIKASLRFGLVSGIRQPQRGSWHGHLQ